VSRLPPVSFYRYVPFLVDFRTNMKMEELVEVEVQADASDAATHGAARLGGRAEC